MHDLSCSGGDGGCHPLEFFWDLSDDQNRRGGEGVAGGRAKRDKELGAPLFSVGEEIVQ